MPIKSSGQDDKFKKSPNPLLNQYIVVLNDQYVDDKASAPAIASEADYLSYVYGGKTEHVYSTAERSEQLRHL